MRVALLTPYLPSPANTGGRIRIFRLAQSIARDAEVWLYACAGVREAQRQREFTELGVYASVRVRNNDLGAVLPWINARRVRRSCPAALARDLAGDHAQVKFDVVVAEHSYATATAHKISQVPMVLDEHNVESAYQTEYFASQSRGQSMRERREIDLLSRWERTAWLRANLVTCVSESDRERIRAARSGPIELIANGTAIRDLEFKLPSQRAGQDVLFVGLMSHAPNMAAAIYLAREVMPIVWTELPDARLILCGRSPAREVTALANSRVEITGTVDSVVPYLSRAKVYANALFHGAGSSLKVPEALASGVPMISTALGARGFPLEQNIHFLGAESPQMFASQIIRIIRSTNEFDAQAQAARSIALDYDWDVLGDRFAKLVRNVAESSRH